MLTKTGLHERKEIYDKYLEEISNIKFTFREIDIIACILHNRGEKKIGELLSISYRTVSAHVRNLMNKFGCNSKDSIIDAIEKSGKLQYLRQYYFLLTVQSSFEKQLNKIGKTLNRSAIKCIIDFSQVTTEEQLLIQQLDEHLKIANINIVSHAGKTPINSIEDITVKICVIGQKRPLDSINKTDFNIFLLFDNQNKTASLEGMNDIDFCAENNYYISVLKLVCKIINNESVQKVVEEFEKEFKFLQNSWHGTGIIQNPDDVSDKVSKPRNHKLPIIGVVITIIIIFCIYIGYQENNLFDSSNSQIDKLVFNLDELIATSEKSELSPITIKKGNLQRNYALARQFEQIIKNSGKDKLKNYFATSKDSSRMIKYLYILRVVSTFYNYNNFEFNKAGELLLFGKDIIENYVSTLSKIPVNFDHFAKEEILSELDLVDGLPEIYTKIIYTLGVTNMYLDNISEARSYFELSEYLGNNLNVLEGVLSKRKGLMTIQQYNILADIKNNNSNELAKQKLFNLIKLYKHYKSSNQKYLIYTPFGNINAILLKNDKKNVVASSIGINQCYMKLILIADNQKQREQYANLILKQYIEIFGIINEVNNRQKARIYNNLGYSLLQMYDAQINLKTIKDELNKFLKIDQSTDLGFIEDVFNLATKHSRNSDNTKAVSYSGLASVYKKQIDSQNLTHGEKQKLTKKLKAINSRRDMINNALHITRHIIGISQQDLSDTKRKDPT